MCEERRTRARWLRYNLLQRSSSNSRLDTNGDCEWRRTRVDKFDVLGGTGMRWSDVASTQFGEVRKYSLSTRFTRPRGQGDVNLKLECINAYVVR